MPRFNLVTLEAHRLPTGAYGYSAVGLEKLGASEYTVATIIVDVSGSVDGFVTDMEAALKEIVKSLRLSPRADNLLLRFVTFSDTLEEVHGYKLLDDCNPDDYDGSLVIRYSTALYDASENAIAAAVDFGQRLTDDHYLVNGAVYIITDGCDNQSRMGAADVAKALKSAHKREALESLISILIGVNINDPAVASELARFNQEAGFSQYVELKDAKKSTLAQLAGFVSKSVSSQSNALGTGGPSGQLTF